MPTVPQTTLQAGGRPSNPFAGMTPRQFQGGIDATGRAITENVLPGASDAAAVRDSLQLGSAIGPALREGRYGDAVRAFLDSTTAALGALPMVPSMMGVVKALHGEQAALDMSPQARQQRAKEQGFTTEAYHGMGRAMEGDAVVIGHPERSDTGFLGTGFYASESPRIASGYASMKGARAAPGSEAPNVMPLRLKLENPKVISPAEKQRLSGMPQFERDDWLAEQQRAGHDGVVVEYGDGKREYMVPDASQVRSTQAAFDPAKRGSGNILAGTAGAVAVGGAAAYALYGGQAEAKPAAERAADGMAALADPRAWVRGPGGTLGGGV